MARRSIDTDEPSARQPLAHSPESAADRLSIPRRAVYTLIASGELDSFKLGRRRLISETSLVRFVERLSGEA